MGCFTVICFVRATVTTTDSSHEDLKKRVTYTDPFNFTSDLVTCIIVTADGYNYRRINMEEKTQL
jgi:hypothetical protein